MDQTFPKLSYLQATYSLKSSGEIVVINNYHRKAIIKEKFCFFSWNCWDKSRVYCFLENITHADSVARSPERSRLHLAVCYRLMSVKVLKIEGWIEIPQSHLPFGRFYSRNCCGLQHSAARKRIIEGFSKEPIKPKRRFACSFSSSIWEEVASLNSPQMEENVPTMVHILVTNKATSELKEAEATKTPLWINLRDNNLKIWAVYLYIWELCKKVLLFIYRKSNDILKNIGKIFL